MRRKRAAARAAGGSAVPTSARKALAGKLQRAAASLKAKTPITKRAKKKPKPVQKPAKKRATKAKPPGAKVVGRITPKVKSKTPKSADPGGMVRETLNRAADIVLGDGPFSLHDAKQVIGIVRDAREAIAVVDSHRPSARVEAELSQFVQVALDFIPQKRRADFRRAPAAASHAVCRPGARVHDPDLY